MRVAALYDIHGNLPALEAVLAEVEREGVDAIVIGGDIASGPPQPREVVELVRSLPNAHCIRGNADRLLDPEFADDEGLGWLLDRIGRSLHRRDAPVDGLAGALDDPADGRARLVHGPAQIQGAGALGGQRQEGERPRPVCQRGSALQSPAPPDRPIHLYGLSS